MVPDTVIAKGALVLTLTIAPYQPQDYARLCVLARKSPDTGLVHFTAEHLVPPDEADHALGVEAQIFVAWVDGEPAGAADVIYGNIQYEGERRPAALLGSLMGSLMVHPRHRRHGVASALAAHRVAAAREHLGPGAVLLADIQQGNIGSLRTAAKWCNAESRPFVMTATRVSRATPSGGRFTVRPATPADVDEILDGLQAFYASANFYRPQDPASLRQWIAEPGVSSPRAYFVATDASGRIVAGLGITHLYRYLAHRIVGLPLWMRALDLIFHEMPAGGLLREADLGLLFHRPDSLAVAHQLWEAARSGLAGDANTLLLTFDPQGPLAPLAAQLWRRVGGGNVQAAILADRPPDPARPLVPWVL